MGNTLTDIPPELKLIIIKLLDGASVFRCRRVCRAWQDLIDSIPEDKLWLHLCTVDFPHIYQILYKKSTISYKELYRNLYRWPSVEKAWEFSKELCSFDTEINSNRDVHVYKDVITVTQECFIKQFHLQSGNALEGHFPNSCHDYKENLYGKFMLSSKVLYCFRKLIYHEGLDSCQVINGVLRYCIHEHFCYFINTLQEIRVCDLKCASFPNHRLITKCDRGAGVIAMDFFVDRLSMMTVDRKFMNYFPKTNSLRFNEDFTLPHTVVMAGFLCSSVLYGASYYTLYICTQGKCAAYKTSVSTVKMHGNVLMIGTVFGEVNAFYIEDGEAFLHLDMEKPLWSSKIVSGDEYPLPVVSIEIAERPFGHQVLLANKQEVRCVTLDYTSPKRFASSWTEETLTKEMPYFGDANFSQL